MTIAQTTGLRFAAAISASANTERAIAEACGEAGEQLGASPDLALAFVSHQHGPEFGALAAEIFKRSGARCLLGCTGESIVGNAQEIEESPALSLWLAVLPGVSILPMHLEFERTPEGGTIVGWPDELPLTWPAGSALFVLGEPFSFPADVLAARLNEDQPGIPVVGGMASGAQSPGANRLFFNDRELDGGAVAALVQGPVEIRSVVSQGCRPIGRHYVVTKADQNVIIELSGKPPLAQLQEVLDTLTPREKQLVQRGLHVGRAINEYQDTFRQGDFLVRNVIGADPRSGAIAIGDFVRPGQTVQFHIRDAQTADEELRELLSVAGEAEGPAPLGALLFTCNGRGTRLFSTPNHDAGVLAQALGQMPVAGFFAQGELGPVGGKNFLHGFTASIALFSPRAD